MDVARPAKTRNVETPKSKYIRSMNAEKSPVKAINVPAIAKNSAICFKRFDTFGS